jgi:hypothetical protein
VTTTTPRRVLPFADGAADQKNLLGGKGANLAEMTNIGLPVPPGFIVTTDACRDYLRVGDLPDGLMAEVHEQLAALEERMGLKLGDPERPLLVSVRSGAPFSMPGMMDTVLNLGAMPATVPGLIGLTGDPRHAWDSVRRFVEMFGRVVLGVDAERYDDALRDAIRTAGVKDERDLDRRAARGGRPRPPRDHRGRRARDPRRPARAAAARDRGRVPVVERAAGACLPQGRGDPRRPRDRRQRPGDGRRQPRRRLGHRRRLHP